MPPWQLKEQRLSLSSVAGEKCCLLMFWLDITSRPQQAGQLGLLGLQEGQPVLTYAFPVGICQPCKPLQTLL
jgi:hypothetical protein